MKEMRKKRKIECPFPPSSLPRKKTPNDCEFKIFFREIGGRRVVLLLNKIFGRKNIFKIMKKFN